MRAAALACLLAVPAGPGAAACRLALALGLDVSASVDAEEYRLQLDGLAAALDAPAVRSALFAMPGAPVAVAVYEWSGAGARRMLLDWTLLTSPRALDGAILRISGTERVEMSDSTALGEALLYGGDLLGRGPGCWRAVLDISGDGMNNDGPDPDMLEGEAALAGVTVNALVIGTDGEDGADLRQVRLGELSAYFAAEVIRGPGAFVETALGFRDYQRAMVRKLVREVESTVVGAAGP